MRSYQLLDFCPQSRRTVEALRPRSLALPRRQGTTARPPNHSAIPAPQVLIVSTETLQLKRTDQQHNDCTAAGPTIDEEGSKGEEMESEDGTGLDLSLDGLDKCVWLPLPVSGFGGV